MNMKLSELQNRRLALISEMPENSVAILSSANRNYRTRDVENPYRQDSDFLYINGLSEPNLVSIIYKENNEPKTVLFRDNTSEHEKIWEGNRLDNNDIKKLYGFNEILNYSDYKNKILNYKRKHILIFPQ